MKNPIAAVAFALAATVANAAHVGDPSAFPKLNCKSDELSQPELDQCAGRDFNAADDKLNALYKSLITKYHTQDATLLKTAERAWITYRDAECSFETNGTAGGTINSMEFTICRTDKTRARIKELSAQLNCEEGDLLCNLPPK